MDKTKKFVVLESIVTGDVFWTTHDGTNPERMVDGTIAYKVIKYVDTEEEAQQIWRENSSPFAMVSRLLGS